MPKFKVDDIVMTKNEKNQPEGRDQMKIVGFDAMYGVYAVKYKDGTLDHVSSSLVDKHWDVNPACRTKLWKIMNGEYND